MQTALAEKAASALYPLPLAHTLGLDRDEGPNTIAVGLLPHKLKANPMVPFRQIVPPQSRPPVVFHDQNVQVAVSVYIRKCTATQHVLVSHGSPTRFTDIVE